MSAQYTPGPWLAEHRAVYGGGYNTEVFSATHGVIAICGWTPKPLGDGVTGTYRAANARLIAAAPELLDALRAAVDLYGKPGGPWNVPGSAGCWITQARAAIAAATSTGEPTGVAT